MAPPRNLSWPLEKSQFRRIISFDVHLNELRGSKKRPTDELAQLEKKFKPGRQEDNSSTSFNRGVIFFLRNVDAAEKCSWPTLNNFFCVAPIWSFCRCCCRRERPIARFRVSAAVGRRRRRRRQRRRQRRRPQSRAAPVSGHRYRKVLVM